MTIIRCCILFGILSYTLSSSVPEAQSCDMNESYHNSFGSLAKLVKTFLVSYVFNMTWQLGIHFMFRFTNVLLRKTETVLCKSPHISHVQVLILCVH